MKIGIVQMTASADLDWNLEVMENYLTQAVSQGAKLVVFPEMAYLMGKRDQWSSHLGSFDKLIAVFKDWAATFKVDLVPGSLREPSKAHPTRYYNVSPYIDSTGKVLASYRKIFLFKATLPDRKYDETKECLPGDSVQVVSRPFGKVGMAICYDLRFPELFRALGEKEAQFILLPASFTVPTGNAHWEVLIRARAIENQCFLIAPALTGKCGDGRETYGHSLVVSPWGEVLLDLGVEPSMQVIDLDLTHLENCRSRIDVRASQRPALFSS